jgi:hypothetical protein
LRIFQKSKIGGAQLDIEAQLVAKFRKKVPDDLPYVFRMNGVTNGWTDGTVENRKVFLDK